MCKNKYTQSIDFLWSDTVVVLWTFIANLFFKYLSSVLIEKNVSELKNKVDIKMTTRQQ